MDGEIGRMQGIVFVDDNGNPVPPADPSTCPQCHLKKNNGTYWDAHQFGPYGSMTRWQCPNGHTWVTCG